MSSRRVKRQSQRSIFETVREMIPMISMRSATFDRETNVNFISLRERHLSEAFFAKTPRTATNLSAYRHEAIPGIPRDRVWV